MYQKLCKKKKEGGGGVIKMYNKFRLSLYKQTPDWLVRKEQHTMTIIPWLRWYYEWQCPFEHCIGDASLVWSSFSLTSGFWKLHADALVYTTQLCFCTLHIWCSSQSVSILSHERKSSVSLALLWIRSFCTTTDIVRLKLTIKIQTKNTCSLHAFAVVLECGLTSYWCGIGILFWVLWQNSIVEVFR